MRVFLFAELVFLASSANLASTDTTIAVTANAAPAQIQRHDGMLRREDLASKGSVGRSVVTIDDAKDGKESPSNAAPNKFDEFLEADDRAHRVGTGNMKAKNFGKSFEEYDINKSGALEEDEAKKLMSDMNLPVDEWKAYDEVKDDNISRGGVERLKEDAAIFYSSDENADGFLDSTEVESVLKRAGLKQADLNWKAFDADKNDKLSLKEFLMAGPAAARAVRNQVQSLLEEDSQEEEEDDGAEEEEDDGAEEKAPGEVLEDPDVDEEGASLLDILETDEEGDEEGEEDDEHDEKHDEEHDEKEDDEDFPGNGKEHDEDGSFLEEDDGEGSESDAHDEAHDESREHSREGFEDDEEEHQEEEHRMREQEHALSDSGDIYVWEKFETDNDGLLNEKETSSFIEKSGLKSRIDWKTYDVNKDNSLDEREFLALVTDHKHDCSKEFINEVRTAVFEGRRGDGSFIEEDDELEAKPAENHIFKMADVNENGYLEENEIADLMSTTNTDKDFDWKKFDKDGDGKLSEAEFTQAGQEEEEDMSAE